MENKKTSLHKPVLILWEDIIDLPIGWIEIDDALDHENVHEKDKYTVHQYGTLIADEEEYVLVASAVFEDKSLLSHVTRIPKGAIKSISYLEEKKSE